MSKVNCFNPKSASGSDGYINYKMSGGDNLGSGGGLGCGLFGWGMPIDFNVLKINGVLPTTVEVFIGCKVGDIIELMGKEWKIEDVIF